MHRNIMPRHPWDLSPVVHVLEWLIERLEVTDSRIAEVFPRPNLRADVAVASALLPVNEDMLRRVPSSETEINATHKSNYFVDYA